ncbi:PQQ-binding-like beta-propeller repeat protein [Planctomycetota bacterium]
MARKPIGVVLVLLLAASSTLAGQVHKTWIRRARDFTQQSFKAAGREFKKVMDSMHTETVRARQGLGNALTDVTKSGREGMDSIKVEVGRIRRGAFTGTRRTMTNFTRNFIPVGGAEEDVPDTVVAREITSPAIDPLFLRRHDVVLAWRTSTGGRPIRKSMVLEDRTIFEDSGAELYSFDPRNGIAQWVFPLPKPSQVGYREDKDHLFVVASDTLFELDRRIGLPRRRIIFPFPVATTPVFGTDIVVVGSWDRRVYAMNREKRVKLWAFMPIHTVQAGPALAPTLAFCAETSGKLSAYSPADRRALWEYKADDAIRVDLVLTSNHIIFPSEDLYVHCVNRFGGFRSWKFPVRGFVRQPVWVTDERCYFAAENDALYAIDLFKGSLIWRVPKGGWPIAIGKQNLYIQGADDEIWAIDRKTGEQVWAVSYKPFVYVAHNTLSDHIYLCSAKGDIYALYLRGDHLDVKKPPKPPRKPGEVEEPAVERPAQPEVRPPAVPETPVEPVVPGAPKKPAPKKPGEEEEEDW